MQNRTIIHLAFASTAMFVASMASAQDSYQQLATDRAVDAFEPTAATAVSPKGGANVEIYTTLADFQAATTGAEITLETFAGRDPNGVSPCYEPVNHEIGQPGTNLLPPVCHEPGTLVPGFSLRTNLGSSSSAGQVMFAFGANTVGIGVNVIGAMNPATVTRVNFTGQPAAVAMDAWDWQAGTPLTFDVYGEDGSPLTSTTVAPVAPPFPAFAGFVSDQPIRRVDVRSASGATQMISNLRFGGATGRLEAVQPQLDFGAVAAGQQHTLTAEFRNVGVAEVRPALLAPTAPFSSVLDGCSSQPLAPQATCEVEVGFSAGDVQHYHGTLQMATVGGQPGAGAEVALAAQTAISRLQVPTALLIVAADIGEHGTPRRLTIRNLSAVASQVNGVTWPAAPFEVIGGSCPEAPFQLQPGQSCWFDVGLLPVQAEHAGSMMLHSDDPSSPHRVVLLGRAGGALFSDGFEGGD